MKKKKHIVDALAESNHDPNARWLPFVHILIVFCFIGFARFVKVSVTTLLIVIILCFVYLLLHISKSNTQRMDGVDSIRWPAPHSRRDFLRSFRMRPEQEINISNEWSVYCFRK